MSLKAEKIKEMIEMQRKFIELEQRGLATAQAYWMPENGAELDGFKERYAQLANEVVDAAHGEKGSKR